MLAGVRGDAGSTAGRTTGCTRPRSGGCVVDRYTSRRPRPTSNSVVSYNPYSGPPWPVRVSTVASETERAIDSLSNPEVSIADALRQLLVVARRIGADDVLIWLRSELEGYKDDATVPDYRDGSSFPITVRFDGPMRSWETLQISASELPADLRAVLNKFSLGMPVAEMEALANADGEGTPRLPLPMRWVMLYREAVEQRTVPGLSFHVANEAYISIPKTYLAGPLDRVKTVALGLALDIEGVSTEAGASGGPTVESEPALGKTVASHMTMIFAHNSSVSVASGAGATAVQLQVGDVPGLLHEAGKLLAEDGVEALRAALKDDGDKPAEATRGFLDTVKAGAYGLAGGLTTNAAYDGLVVLLHQVFPGLN